MKKSKIPYRRITSSVIFLILISIVTGVFLACKLWFLLIIAIPLLALSISRLISVYKGIINRLDFIIRAIRNDDYSFRFTENPDYTENAIVNYSLNEIKAVMDEKKRLMREDEKNFELIMECANIGIMLLMENGFIEHANSKVLEIFSLSRISHITQLKNHSEELVEILKDINPSEQKSVRYFTELGEINLVLSCSAINYKNKNLRIVTIGNINRELDNQESMVWERLTRILTHEIMNSLSPITSISNTLMNDINDSKKVGEGLEIIHSTSDRLMHFVNSFRQVTRMPMPQKAPFYLVELINDAVTLIDFGKIKISININPEDTLLYADKNQLSQVVVNILKNAVEACRGNDDDKDYLVEVNSYIDTEERIHLEISNNGGEISEDLAENIFTPFFTTKDNGSGIGLALSRQIIRLHGGTIHLSKNSDDKVAFMIILE